jgi:ATP-dependent protease ClpP protease subunit
VNITLPGKALTFMASQRQRAEKQREQLGVEAQSWYRITNQASSDEAEILLYDEIGGWWGCTAEELVDELRDITAPNIRVRINSPGGSVFEGIAIANALRAHPANVIVQVDGLAASIASVIAMAGDRVEMAPNTMLMIHDASGLCYGTATDMEEMGQLLDLLSDNIADAYAARAGGTRDEWRALMRAETWYLPDAAVEAGLADEATHTPQAGDPVEEPEPELEPKLEPAEPEMRRRFDFAAYGYRGPQQPESAPQAGAQPTLVVSIADLLDGDAVARLRAAVAPPVEAPAATEPAEPAEEPAAEPEAEPTEEPGDEPEPPVDEWAAMTAHLTQDDADTWSALVSNVIEPDTSSSAATA